MTAIEAPSHGGARPGAGRPARAAVTLTITGFQDPKAFLLTVMNDQQADARLRVDAAKALMPFIHAKLVEGGKKDGQKRAADDAGQGKYASAPPPLRSIRK